MDNSQRPQPAQHTPGPWHRMNLEWGFSFKRYNPGNGFEGDWEFRDVTVDQAADAPAIKAERDRLLLELEAMKELKDGWALKAMSEASKAGSIGAEATRLKALNTQLIEALQEALDAMSTLPRDTQVSDMPMALARAALAAAKGVKP